MIKYLDSLTYDDIGLIARHKSTMTSRSDPDTEINLLHGAKLAAPIIAAPMDTVCGPEMVIALAQHGLLGILHNNCPIIQQASDLDYVLKTVSFGPTNQTYNVGFAIGVAGDYFTRLNALLGVIGKRFPRGIQNNINLFLCFDTANGFSTVMENAINSIPKVRLDQYRIITIAGNIMSSEGFLFLEGLGIDIIRVGIGTGAPCSTSVVTGVGRGIVSVIDECADIPNRKSLILADGGIKSAGDVVKAIAIGADMVMAGNLFAGFDESPGEVRNGKKIFRGMASFGVAADKNKLNRATKIIIPEGVEKEIDYKGSLQDFIEPFVGGIRASMTYLNCSNIDEIKNLKHEPRTFVQHSSAAQVHVKPFSS